VDQPIPIPSDQPWRRTALVASAIAGFELFALIVLVFVLLGKPVVREIREHAATQAASTQHAAHPKTTKAAPDAKKAKAPSLSRHQTSVMVLNGNGIQGAAGQESAALHSLGYMIAGTGNAERSDIRHTLVMYRPGYKPEAERLAADLHGARVGPLDGLTPAELDGAHLALVLGSDAVDRG
jgi:hypothetical protein